MNKSELDKIVIEIEFLIISIIQGIALSTLAISAMSSLTGLRYEYWPYVLSALIILLVFWALAISHTVSFISWPLSMSHNFLYFVATLLEVIAFAYVSNPLLWFAFNFLFFLVAGVLYFLDLKLIEWRKDSFSATDAQQKLYAHIHSDQRFQIAVFVPSIIIFSFAAWMLIYFFPLYFIEGKHHLWLIGIQIIMGFGAMFYSVKTFGVRARLISEVAKNKEL